LEGSFSSDHGANNFPLQYRKNTPSYREAKTRTKTSSNPPRHQAGVTADSFDPEKELEETDLKCPKLLVNSYKSLPLESSSQ